MKKKAVLVSYIYPSAEQYLADFIDTVNDQSSTDFEVILFNDSTNIETEDLGELLPSFRVINIDHHKSIANIRFDSFQYLAKQDYNYVIFQDIDDTMSRNRVEQTISALAVNPIVCNDLSIIKNGKITSSNVWSDRLEHNFNFDKNFIIDKNIIGLGNSGIRSDVLQTQIVRDNTIQATDWFVFYQLMYSGNRKATFITDCTTVYNQHDHNTAGLSDELNFERLYNATIVKKRHYSGLLKSYPNLNKELERVNAFERTLEKYKDINIKLTKFPFWWEETEMI